MDELSITLHTIMILLIVSLFGLYIGMECYYEGEENGKRTRKQRTRFSKTVIPGNGNQVYDPMLINVPVRVNP